MRKLISIKAIYQCKKENYELKMLVNALMNAFNFSLPESRVSTELIRILHNFAYDLSGNFFQWPDGAQCISNEIVSA